MFAFCWAINLLAAAALAYTVMAYGYCFGESQVRDVFYAWGYGLGISWLISEAPQKSRSDAPAFSVSPHFAVCSL